MKSLTRYLTFSVPERMGFRNITPVIAHAVSESGVQKGLVLVKTRHGRGTPGEMSRLDAPIKSVIS